MAIIGIYSGTFDPIHNGHVAFAKAAIAEFDISTLYILPEAKPRFKSQVTDVLHRQAMISLATKHMDVKAELPGMSDQHDVATSLKIFEDQHPNDQIVLLLGADVFLNIDKWKNWQDLVVKTKFAVALRTEDDGEEVVIKQQSLPKVEVTKIVTNEATISSSKIRESLKGGQEPKGLDPKVLDYIRQNHLYGS